MATRLDDGRFFRVAEALAILNGSGILAIDDLGDGLDSGSAIHFASLLRRSCGQAWVTTRIPHVAEVFDPSEVVRLGRTPTGKRTVHQGKQPASKAEFVSAKHWHRNLLPALNYRAVIVVEGPNDFAALHALAMRLANEFAHSLPESKGITIINAGSGGSGGNVNVLKLAGAAREMGLRSVGIVDGDTDTAAKKYLKENIGLADAAIRLPNKAAIELVIVEGIPDAVLRQAVEDIASFASLTAPLGLAKASGDDLIDLVIPFVKSNSLHAALIDALPAAHLPKAAVALLTRAVEVACDSTKGLVQL